MQQAGETRQLTAQVSPDNVPDKTVTWSSSDNGVATVSDGGIVTAVGNGTADIIATTKFNQVTAVCRVSVNIPRKLSGLDISLTDSSYVYDGTAKEPKVIIRDDQRNAGGSVYELIEGQDYTLSYNKNIWPGIASVTVRAVDGSGYTGTQMYNFQICPQMPVLSQAVNTSSGIALTWNTVEGAEGYHIFRKTGSGQWKRIAAITNGYTKEYTDKSVKTKNGVLYKYAVRAYADVVTGAYDRTGKAVLRLTAPVLSKVSAQGSRKLQAKWSKNSKGSGYQLQYSTSKKFQKASTIKISSNKTLQRTITKLTKGKRYYIRVRSMKKSGNTTYYSKWSNVRNTVVK